ncbi:MAG: formyltetrahydrofolate deformylase [Candidatus Dadabacteria bacterium]|nr:MAG: formyltetrahydrofolate deformylase [Candidatus Dadabacteria bacterium]
MSTQEQNRSAILLIHCPDRKGLVSAITEFIFKNDGNILYLDQHVDAEQNIFFMRVEWDLANFSIHSEKIGEYFDTLIGEKFEMQWRLYFSDYTPRMAIFVSKMSHCLHDILSRSQSGEWNVEVPLIISNHTDLEPIARTFGIDHHTISVTKENKKNAEEKQLEFLKKYKIDFIVLARYMQILSDEFVSHYPNKIINIHHSFLPAFPGAKPYHSAYERGVKIIGATSHYVTADLDAGPIIEQSVVRVSHKDNIEDLVRKGRDLEKVVLSQAIWHHLKRHILVYGNRTLIFD